MGHERNSFHTDDASASFKKIYSFGGCLQLEHHNSNYVFTDGK